MKPILPLVSVLLLAGLSAAHAQALPSQTIEASKMPESGPAVAGGNGATVGPNARNQAIAPMPGMSDEPPGQLAPGGRPGAIALPLPAPPVRKR